MLIGNRSGFIGVKSAKLPYDAEVEYLESTGAQRIDTGILFSGPCSMRLIASFTPTTNEMDLFGAYKIGSAAQMVCGCYNRFIFGYNSPASRIDSSSFEATQTTFDISYTFADNGIRTLSVNGSSYANSASYYNDVEIVLFRSNYAGMFKCMRFEVMDANGVLVRDFIPVRFTNELGQSEGAMYDRVSGQLFRNQGTGAFTYGRDINPISARSYVNDGLIAIWDGIENAGWGTHDASATQWKDLKGQYDFTLQGAVFDDNSLVSTAKGNVATAASYPVVQPYSPKTIEILVKCTGGDQCIAKFGFWQLWRESSGVYYFYPTTAGSNVTSNMALADENRANTFSFLLIDQQTMATYCNGVLQSGGKKDYWSTEVWQFFGRNSNYSTGNSYCARYYSRALTAAEIAANYAVDKQRFNLP